MFNDVSFERNPNVLLISSYASIRFSSSANRLPIMTRYVWVLNVSRGLQACFVCSFFIRHLLDAAQPIFAVLNLFGRHLVIDVKPVPCKLNRGDQWCHQASYRIQADCRILEANACSLLLLRRSRISFHPARKSLSLISRICFLLLVCRKLIQDFLNALPPLYQRFDRICTLTSRFAMCE